MLKSIFSFFWPRDGSNPGPPPNDTETNEDGASVASDDNGTSPPSPPLSRSIGKRPRVDGTPGRSSLRASGSRRPTVATPKGKGVVFAPQPPSSRKIKPLPRRRPKESKYWTYVSESSSEGEEPSPSPTKRKAGHDEEDSDYEPVSPHTRGSRTTQPTTQPARAVNRAIRGDGGKDDEPRPAKRSRFDSVELPATHMTRLTVSDRSPRAPSALRRVQDAAEDEVPSPRRGRGRPPKNAGTPKKEETSTPSRPRGRPPKEDTATATAGPSSGLRARHSLPSKVEELRRGQPRHARPSLPMTEVVDDPAPETEEPSPAPVAETPRRGRGRPRKSEPVPRQPSAGPEPEAEVPPRRGRGRPRKSEPSSHDPLTESESEPEVEVETPRRGRGRPRKSEPSLHQPPTQPEPEVEVPRRGRGRPRKSEPTLHDPEPDAETPRRGRGRPPKIVSASAPASPATPRRRGRPPKAAAALEAHEEPETPRRRGRPSKTAVAASEPRRSGRPHQPTKYWTYETVSSSSASP